MRVHLARLLIAPQRNSFKKVLVAKFVTEVRQVRAARAARKQIVECKVETRLTPQPRQPALEVRQVAVISQARGERGRAT